MCEIVSLNLDRCDHNEFMTSCDMNEHVIRLETQVPRQKKGRSVCKQKQKQNQHVCFVKTKIYTQTYRSYFLKHLLNSSTISLILCMPFGAVLLDWSVSECSICHLAVRIYNFVLLVRCVCCCTLHRRIDTVWTKLEREKQRKWEVKKENFRIWQTDLRFTNEIKCEIERKTTIAHFVINLQSDRAREPATNVRVIIGSNEMLSLTR